ncbi:putative phage head-tail adaptor [Trichostrongylus colubriformis]|uniref:Phage head-tail adaptor n=1 Tax=Trichostrongylus colubriformis TaxID=6319 RepID=A0AAN8FER1_TRICO
MTEVRSDRFTMIQNWQVISDTGTSLIGAPSAVVEDIAKNTGAMYDEQYDAYFIDCNAQPSLDLVIGQNSYHIEGKNLVVPAGDGRCMLSLFGMSSHGFGPAWILGDPFIRQFCQIHDVVKKQIGFAPSLQK